MLKIGIVSLGQLEAADPRMKPVLKKLAILCEYTGVRPAIRTTDFVVRDNTRQVIELSNKLEVESVWRMDPSGTLTRALTGHVLSEELLGLTMSLLKQLLLRYP